MAEFTLMKVILIGKSPLLMNWYSGEQPSMEKAPRGKKTWTHIENGRKSKWLRAAYWSDEHQCFHIPAENIDRMLADGARRFRKQLTFKQDVMCESIFIPLQNADGERYGTGMTVRKAIETKEGQFTKVDKVKAAGLEDFFGPDHVDIRGVVIGKARVDACRPRFANWRIDFTVRYTTETVEEAWIAKSLERNCLGDFRPRFGQFNATVSRFKD